MASFSAHRGDDFQKKIVQNGLSFRFCKIGLRNTLFIVGRKMVVSFVGDVVGGNFVRFWLTSFFLIEALIELRKMLIRKPKETIILCTVWE